MIDPRELRIGNYVEYNGKIIDLQLEEFVAEYQFGNIFESMNPIKLTEQHLIDFGFEKANLEYYQDVYDIYFNDMPFKQKLQYSISEQKIWIIRYHSQYEGDNSFVNVSECKYVHQLQNLYKSLCGKELTK